VISSLSLPVGALLGIYLRISRRTNSALLAFGAGALLFAITIELYGNAIFEHEESDSDDKLPMILLAIGSLLGSALFSGSNYVIEHQDKVKRKIIIKPTLMLASAGSNLSRLGRTASQFNLSTMSFSFRVPENADPDPIPDDEIPFSNAVYGDDTDDDDDAEEVESLEDERAPPSNRMRRSRSSAADSLDSSIETLPLTGGEPAAALGYQAAAAAEGAARPAPAATAGATESTALNGDAPGSPAKKRRASVSSADSHDDPEHDHHVGVAIWLGLLIDSLPESLVIGILATAENGISITFILGVFLSNLPEALSSTVIMRRAGLGRVRIMVMWFSIVIITGVGAFIGAIAFRGEVRYAAQQPRRRDRAVPPNLSRLARATCAGGGSPPPGNARQGARRKIHRGHRRRCDAGHDRRDGAAGTTADPGARRSGTTGGSCGWAAGAVCGDRLALYRRRSATRESCRACARSWDSCRRTLSSSWKTRAAPATPTYTIFFSHFFLCICVLFSRVSPCLVALPLPPHPPSWLACRSA